MTPRRFAGVTMSIIDTQRIAAVATLGSLDHTSSLTDVWSALSNATFTTAASCHRSRCAACAFSLEDRQARRRLRGKRGGHRTRCRYRGSLRAQAVATGLKGRRQGLTNEDTNDLQQKDGRD